MSGHHPATVRRAGRKRGARFESSEALEEQPAVARSAVELHRASIAVLTVHSAVDSAVSLRARRVRGGTRQRLGGQSGDQPPAAF